MNLSSNNIERTADSLVKIALIGGALRGAWNVGKGAVRNVFGSAFSSTKGKSLGEKTFAWGSRIGLGVGAYGAGKAIYNRLPGIPAQPNYTTALRNNVLAGRISPSELNPEDLNDVRALGMRKMSNLAVAGGLKAVGKWGGRALTALGAGFYGVDALGAAKATMGASKMGFRPVAPKFNVEGGMKA